MSPKDYSEIRQPLILKNSETELFGMHSFDASRFVLGYVVSGTKYIYTGDVRQKVNAGEVFFLSRGTHFVEEVPDPKQPFKQIMFFYTPELLGKVISQLSLNHSIDAHIHHSCRNCRGREHVVEPGWDTLRNFFISVNMYLSDSSIRRDPTAEQLKFTELVYIILSHSDGCLRSRLLGSTDPEKELFEQTVYEYIFSDISLEQLAAKNNRSLTSFKKTFKSHFNEPPHQWVVRQRLMHSRLLLISTNQPIAVVGTECRFPNTSHFIKLFRKEFGVTPASYRRKYSSDIAKRTSRSPEGLSETGADNRSLS